MKYLLVLLCLVCACATVGCDYYRTSEDDADDADWVLCYEVSTANTVTVSFMNEYPNFTHTFTLENDRWYVEFPIDDPMIYGLKVIASEDTKIFAAVYIKESDNKSIFILQGGEQKLDSLNAYTYECSGMTPWY